MLEVGKTYRLRGRPLDVDIVGSGVTDGSFNDIGYKGQFFVGIARNDDGGDWVAEYKPTGERLWDREKHHASGDHYDLLIPEQFVSLNQVQEIIRVLGMTRAWKDVLFDRVSQLPTKELVDA